MTSSPYLTDTSPDAVALQLDLIRGMSPTRRLGKTVRLTSELLRASKAAIRRRDPACSAHEVAVTFVELHYGAELAAGFGQRRESCGPMIEQDDVAKALGPVADVLGRLEIRFYVGGSLASSFHGAMRSTMDVDLVADLDDASVTRFLTELGDAYYASEVAIRDAIRQKSSFNLIHLETSFKVDVFPHRGRAFDTSAFARAISGRIGSDAGFSVPIASAEDTILSKLEWYRLGNETSERQWQDVTIVLKLLGEQADVKYLRKFAESVGVGDLLARLLA